MNHIKVSGIASNVAAGVVGAIVGAVIVLAAEGATRALPTSLPPALTPTEDLEVGQPARLDPKKTVLLAWSPGGLPAGTEEALERLPSVIGATTVRAGLDWIESTKTADGTSVDRPRGAAAIPFEVAIIEPSEYADYVAPSEREAILALEEGHAVLARTEAELREAGAGLQINMRGGRVLVTDVVSDSTTQGYEALLAGRVPSTWQRTDRFVLVRVKHRSAQKAVSSLIRSRLEPGRVLRIRAQGETPFLRYGDAVLPQLHVKATFGEFAAAPHPDGSITTDPAWRDKNIVSRSIPILGEVTCHRGLLPQLETAMEQTMDAGLAFTIDPRDFGGCYGPRFIDSNPGGRLSHHSWGIAVDFNVAQNRPGTPPDLDRRFVRIMESNGFTWGGRWLIPDGMHFEWVRFP